MRRIATESSHNRFVPPPQSDDCPFKTPSRFGTLTHLEIQKLKWLLRHGAVNAGIKIRPDGFVNLCDVFSYPPLSHLTPESIFYLVRWSPERKYVLAVLADEDVDQYDIRRQDPEVAKTAEIALAEHEIRRPLPTIANWELECPEGYPALKRMNMRGAGRRWLEHEGPGKAFIRACQGHSIPEIDPKYACKRLLSSATVKDCLHGTKKANEKSIRENGLYRRDRNTIHFAQSEPGRKDAEIVVYINLDEALKDGIVFWLCENGVILSPGDKDGRIPAKYIRCIKDLPQRTPTDYSYYANQRDRHARLQQPYKTYYSAQSRGRYGRYPSFETAKEACRENHIIAATSYSKSVKDRIEAVLFSAARSVAAAFRLVAPPPAETEENDDDDQDDDGTLDMPPLDGPQADQDDEDDYDSYVEELEDEDAVVAPPTGQFPVSGSEHPVTCSTAVMAAPAASGTNSIGGEENDRPEQQRTPEAAVRPPPSRSVNYYSDCQ